jgi:hypothetical protein
VSAPILGNKETTHVNRQVISITRLAVTALLVGIAVVGCAKQGSGAGHPTGSMPTAPASQVAPTAPTLAPTPVGVATESPAATASPPATDTAAPVGTTSPNATTDPLDGSFSDLGNLLNGINSSLSGADAGASGGE